MDGVQWIAAFGAFATVSGLVVVAPYEAGALPRRSALGLRRSGLRIRTWILRRIFRRDIPAAQGTASGEFKFEGTARGTARLAYSADSDISDQLERIRDAISNLQEENRLLNDSIRAVNLTLSERVNELQDSHQKLEKSFSHYLTTTRELNTRGFPLAAVGALLATTPFAFVSPLWIPLFALVIAWSIYSLGRSWKAIKYGWGDS